MRKILALLAAGLLLTMHGCAAPQAHAETGVDVVCTVFPQYDFARQIGGEYVNATLLLAAGQEMHNYEPSPLDVAEIAGCDLFLRIGGESEVWTDTLLEAIDTSHMQVVTLMDAIPDPLDHDHSNCAGGHVHEAEPCTEDHAHEAEPCTEAHAHEHEAEPCTEAHAHEHEAEPCTEAHAHEHEAEPCTEAHAHEHEAEACTAELTHAHFDEHIWNSPVNAIAMVQAVCDALCQADPAHADVFVSRTNDYIASLSKLDADYRTLVAECDEPVLIVADKFPFRYLTAEYGMTYYAAFSGCSSETEPTADSLLTLIAETKEHGCPTVFYLEFSSKKIAGRICEITGAQAAMLRPGHNVSAEDLAEGVTFLSLMQENFNVIKEALT